MRIFCILLFSFSSFVISAQNKIKLGVKAGINYNSNGNLEAISDFEEFYVFESTGRVGYHAGIWSEISLFSNQFFIRPEVVHTFTKSTYKEFLSSDYSLKKIEAPVLIGFKILEIGRVFIGPSFQYIYDSEFTEVGSNNLETDSFSVSLNLGIGIQVKDFGFDVRWEKGLSKNESRLFNGRGVLDSRPNQLIFSLSYNFL